MDDYIDELISANEGSIDFIASLDDIDARKMEELLDKGDCCFDVELGGEEL